MSTDNAAGRNFAGREATPALPQRMTSAHVRVAARAAVLDALQTARRENARDGDIRSTLLSLCAGARDAGLRAEQLLLVIKECWQHQREAQQLPRHDADMVLARVITQCIKEYYEPSPVRES